MKAPLLRIGRGVDGQVVLVVPALARLLAEAGPGQVTGAEWSEHGNLMLQGLSGQAEIALTGGQRAELRRAAERGPMEITVVDHVRLTRLEIRLGG